MLHFVYNSTPGSMLVPVSLFGQTTLHGITMISRVGISCHLNSLAPRRFECDSKNVIFNLVLLIGIFRSFHDNALGWMPQDLTDDKSTLVQVMAWCRQATSHYLSQCWLSSLSSYGLARPQWVKCEIHSLSWVHPLWVFSYTIHFIYWVFFYTIYFIY